MVLSEACNNLIKHSPQAKEIHLEVLLGSEELELKLHDQGEGFVWPEVYGFEKEEYPEGGFGLYLIKELMDEVTYENLVLKISDQVVTEHYSVTTS